MATSKNTYIDFAAAPPVGAMAQAAGTAAAVTDNIVNVFLAPGGIPIQIRNEAQNDDITPTYVVDTDCTTGWQIPNDNTGADAIELGLGIQNTASARYAYTVGTDPAFELRCKLGVPIVADYNVFVGFRKAGAYVTGMDTAAEIETGYADKCGFSFEAGNGHIITSDDNTDVDTDISAAWTNDQVKTLTVKVSAAGAVTYQIDGTTVSDAVAHTVDTGDVLVPYLYFSKVATNADTPPILNFLYVGYTQ